MQESMQNGVKNQRYVNNNKKFQDKFTNSFFEAYTRSVGYIVMLKNRLTILNCRSIFRVFKMLANTSQKSVANFNRFIGISFKNLNT